MHFLFSPHRYENPSLRESATAEYIADRKQFRETGISATKGRRAKMFEEQARKKKEEAEKEKQALYN